MSIDKTFDGADIGLILMASIGPLAICALCFAWTVTEMTKIVACTWTHDASVLCIEEVEESAEEPEEISATRGTREREE